MLDGAFEQWFMETHRKGGAWTFGMPAEVYPNEKGISAQSLALVAQYVKGGDQLYKSYGYVPGLKTDDPHDLVIMYMKKKTIFHWHGDTITRWRSLRLSPGWIVHSPSDIMGGEGPEGSTMLITSEFRSRLQRTLDFLRTNDRPYWTNAVAEHSAFLTALKE